jgi:hypothetical protein
VAPTVAFPRRSGHPLFESPCTMLEEFFHVYAQWGRGMGYLDYVMGWVQEGFDYRQNKYEVEAKFFAVEYASWFSDCANLKCDNRLYEFEVSEYCGYY